MKSFLSTTFGGLQGTLLGLKLAGVADHLTWYQTTTPAISVAVGFVLAVLWFLPDAIRKALAGRRK